MAKPAPHDQRPLFSLVEEGTHLLRRAPLSLWLVHLGGSLPFLLYLFFFWSDMSRSGLAAGRLLESSLILAVLYLFMKVMQAWFCDGLLGLVQGREPGQTPRMPVRGWLRLVASQSWMQATATWVLAFSFVTMVPLTWTYAFYHNVTVLAVDHFRRGGRTRALITEALGQSKWLVGQQVQLLGLLTVGAVLVYVNIIAGLATAASLSKSFTGTENAFTMSPLLFLSTPVQALVFSLCYLVMNPLVKSIYVLRCFYGAARRTGADLEVRLHAVKALQTPVVLAAALLFLMSGTVHAQEGAAGVGGRPMLADAQRGVPGEELDQSIEDVLRGSEFQWRMPRDGEKAAKDDSLVGSTMRGFTDWLNGSIEDLGKMLGNLMDWLFGSKKSNREPTGFEPGSGGGTESSWSGIMPGLLKALAVVLLLALAWVLWRHWRQSRRTVMVETAATGPDIDLEHENLVATQLPENEWLRLAREKMEAGDLRLALRALFLATLAHLGEKRLLHISRTKSNGDYVRELGWRAKGRPELRESFDQQVRTFDRVWYGWHDVSSELMSRFQDQHERITTHAT